MSQQPGWYDDPEDAEVLRYWDGVQWTTHTSPRRRPGLGQTSAAQGQGSSATGQDYGSASQSGQQYGGDQQYGGGQQYGSGQQSGSGQSQNPYAGGWNQNQSAPQYDGEQTRATTPDGQPLSGWWRRFFARIIDGILVGVLTALLIPIFTPDLVGDFSTFFDEMVTAAQAGQPMPTTLPVGITSQLVTVGLVSAVLALLYELVMLKVASGSLGKLALGIRVRLRDEPGPLSWSTSAIRALVWEGPGLLGSLPLIGLLGSLFSLLNGLWPLWDSKKQSLNDKVAKTNVVRKS